MTLAGVDGCPAGWAVAIDDGEDLTFEVVPTIAGVLARVTGIVGIDVPIGLPEAGPRAADRLARQASGRPSSVFPTPVRGVLGAATHAEASARHRAVDGRGMTIQAFGILPKIAEVDAALRADRRLVERVVEVHPEVTFVAMAGERLAHSKKTPAGRAERLALLAPHFGDVPAQAGAGVLRRHLAPDDVLDAFAALWTARRLASGTSQALPDSLPFDAVGLPMAIRI